MRFDVDTDHLDGVLRHLAELRRPVACAAPRRRWRSCSCATTATSWPRTACRWRATGPAVSVAHPALAGTGALRPVRAAPRPAPAAVWVAARRRAGRRSSRSAARRSTTPRRRWPPTGRRSGSNAGDHRVRGPAGGPGHASRARSPSRSRRRVHGRRRAHGDVHGRPAHPRRRGGRPHRARPRRPGRPARPAARRGRSSSALACVAIGAGDRRRRDGHRAARRRVLPAGRARRAPAGWCSPASTAVAVQVSESARVCLRAGAAPSSASRSCCAPSATSRATGSSWASPIGWAQAVHPFSEDRWWPLLLCVVATAALVGRRGHPARPPRPRRRPAAGPARARRRPGARSARRWAWPCACSAAPLLGWAVEPGAARRDVRRRSATRWRRCSPTTRRRRSSSRAPRPPAWWTPTSPPSSPSTRCSPRPTRSSSVLRARTEEVVRPGRAGPGHGDQPRRPGWAAT